MRALAMACVAATAILAGTEGDTALAQSLLLEGDGDRFMAADPPVYHAGDRRDPFLPPHYAPGPEAPSCGARGLEGVLARDLALRGVVRTRQGFLALLLGPRGEAHFARVGSRLCDGIVRAIEPAGVTLEESPGLADFRKQPRQIRLRLHAE